MADGDRFGRAGGAGRGDDVRDIFRLQSNGRPGVRVAVQPEFVHENQPGVRFRERLFRSAIQQNDPRAGFVAHLPQPARGKRRIHRQISAARGEDPGQRANRIRPSLQAHSGHRFRAHAHFPQCVRQLIGRPQQAAIGQPGRPADRHRARITGGPGGELRRHRREFGCRMECDIVPAGHSAGGPDRNRADIRPQRDHGLPASGERQRGRAPLPARRQRLDGGPDRMLPGRVDRDYIVVSHRVDRP